MTDQHGQRDRGTVPAEGAGAGPPRSTGAASAGTTGAVPAQGTGAVPPGTAGAVPPQDAGPEADPWADYLAAAQRLDAVRRAASSAVGEHEATVAAAWQEVDGVRARLAPQHARLVRDFGVPEPELIPQPTELAEAVRAVTGGPDVVLAALREARATADAADSTILGDGPRPTAPWRPWARNLVVYGPLAAVVLLVQMVLYLLLPQGSVPTPALLCGLGLPLVAFGLGWLTIGFVYGDEDTGRADRTPIVGALACLAPVLLTCLSAGLRVLLR